MFFNFQFSNNAKKLNTSILSNRLALETNKIKSKTFNCDKNFNKRDSHKRILFGVFGQWMLTNNLKIAWDLFHCFNCTLDN